MHEAITRIDTVWLFNIPSVTNIKSTQKEIKWPTGCYWCYLDSYLITIWLHCYAIGFIKSENHAGRVQMLWDFPSLLRVVKFGDGDVVWNEHSIHIVLGCEHTSDWHVRCNCVIIALHCPCQRLIKWHRALIYDSRHANARIGNCIPPTSCPLQLGYALPLWHPWGSAISKPH